MNKKLAILIIGALGTAAVSVFLLLNAQREEKAKKVYMDLLDRIRRGVKA